MHPAISGRTAVRLSLALSSVMFLACGGDKESPTPVPAPVISSFTATPSTIDAGASSVLSWSVSGATNVSLDQGIGTVATSSATVTPEATTTYTLTATNAAGKVTKTATVTVQSQFKGVYFGQTLPGETPASFAPEVLTSVSAYVEGSAFSPDGNQCLLAVGDANYSSSKIYVSNRVNDVWSPFVEATFTSGFTFAAEPVYSADGTLLTFAGVGSTGSWDLWTVSITAQGWGTPVCLPSPINDSEAREHRCSYTLDGTMYFTSTRSGMAQVYKAYKDSTQTTVVELVGAPVSTNSYEGDPCVASDGRFLIFYSARSNVSADLYVSFSDGQGGWGPAIDLGSAINTTGDEYGARLSSDGKYLFFTRHNAQGNSTYWVAVSAIDKLKP